MWEQFTTREESLSSQSPQEKTNKKKCTKRPSGFAEAMLEAPPTGPCTLNFCPVGILLGQKVLLKCNTLTGKYKTTPTQIRRERRRILSAGFYWTRSACSRHRVTSRPPSGTQLVLAAVQQLTAGGLFESFYTVGRLDLIWGQLWHKGSWLVGF